MTEAEKMMLDDAIDCAIELNKELCATKIELKVAMTTICILAGIIVWIVLC